MDPEAYEALFTQVAAEYGLDKHLLAEQGWVESRWNPLAIGESNGLGMMQVLPATWSEWAAKIGVYDPFDPESNIRLAAAYLVHLRKHLAENVGVKGDHWVLAAYNWGADNVHRLVQRGNSWENVPETPREYALNILLGADTRALAAAEAR